MARIDVDIDDEAAAVVMQRYDLRTTEAAVNFALRAVAAAPMSLEEAQAMRGAGWEGDLEEMRRSRIL